MDKLKEKSVEGWWYNPDQLRDFTEKVNEKEWGEGLSMEEVEAVLLTLHDLSSIPPVEKGEACGLFQSLDTGMNCKHCGKHYSEHLF